MIEFIYENLTKEKLDQVMRDIFSPDRSDRRSTMSSYWRSLNLAYPSTPSESFKQKSIETMKGNELDIKITNKSSSYGNDRIYRYLVNGDAVLRFDQIPYPECCGIAIIKNFSANGDMSKVDFLDAMGKFIADIKSNDRFSKVLFYTSTGSNGERLFSMLPNVIILDPFKNRRSGNMLIGFEIDLLDKNKSEEWYVNSDEFQEPEDDDFDEEETDGEHDEDEEEDDIFEVRNLGNGIREIVEAQAILDGDPQTRPDTISGGRPTLGNGIMEQIDPRPMHSYFTHTYGTTTS